MQSARSDLIGIILLLVATRVAAAAQEPHPLSVHDLIAMDRISDPQVSPDGRRVAFVKSSLDLDANRRRSQPHQERDARSGVEHGAHFYDGFHGLGFIRIHPNVSRKTQLKRSIIHLDIVVGAHDPDTGVHVGESADSFG